MEKIIIDSQNNRFFPNWKELYQYRDLFWTLSWRDFRVRYAQTSIGFLWAIIQPILTIAILTIVFGRFVGVKTEVPHLVYTVAGMSLWTYFSYVMTNSGNSIIASQQMVKKIYFPRLIIPLSKAVVGLIDLFITLILLVILLIYYKVTITWNILYAPLFIAMAMLAALSIGIWLSALTVRFRDFQHVVPFMVQIGLYITPIAYPIEMVSKNAPEWLQTIYFLNPMAGIIEGFRWSIFGGTLNTNILFLAGSVVTILFISSLWYFRKVEDEMADFV